MARRHGPIHRAIESLLHKVGSSAWTKRLISGSPRDGG
jgi:hypothetical protein